MKKYRSLQFKLVLPISLVFFVALSLALTWEYHQHKARRIKVLQNHTETITHNIAIASENVSDLGSIRRILTAISADQSIIRAFIVRNDSGEIIASTKRQEIGIKWKDFKDIPGQIIELIDHRIDQMFTDRGSKERPIIWNIQPMQVSLRYHEIPNDTPLTLAIAFDGSSAVESAFKAFTYQAFISTILVFLIMTALYLIVFLVVIRPISNIASAVSNSASLEEIVNIPFSSNDEIGILARRLNEMADNLRDKTASLSQQQMQLANSSKLSSLGEMAGGVAHEINNPLAIMSGIVQQLRVRLSQNQFDQKEFATKLDKLKSVVDRIASIVRGLRSFSRSGDQDPMIPTKLSTIIEDTLSLCRTRMQHEGISLHEDYQINAEIKCRPVQISQVLLNLLINAADAVSGSGNAWIRVRAESTDGIIQIRITDSGSGIPDHIAKKMMEPFFTTKPVGKGTGLGLSLTKGIIEEHQGKFRYELFEQHTSFVVEFPAYS